MLATMFENQSVVNSILKLAEKVGPEILNLPVTIIPKESQNVAYIDTKGIFLRQDIIDRAPDQVGMYLAHEIFHPVVHEHEGTWRHSHDVVNCAEDYKINQILLEVFGYDVSNAFVAGLVDSKYYSSSVADICTDLEKLGNKEVRGCGCLGIHHPIVLKLARRLKIKYKSYLRPEKNRTLFSTDLIDDNEYIQVITNARTLLPRFQTLPFIEQERALHGLWCLYTLDKANARSVSENTLTPNQSIVYCGPYKETREEVSKDAEKGIIAASMFLKKVDQDAEYLSDRRLRLKRTIKKIQDSISDKKKKNKARLRKRLVKAELLMMKLNKLKPISEMFLKHAVEVSHKVKQAPVASLKTLFGNSFEGEQNIFLPNFKSHSAIPRRLRAIGKRAFKDFKKVSDVLIYIEINFGDLDQGSDADSTDKPQKEKEETSDNEGNKNEDSKSKKSSSSDKPNSKDVLGIKIEGLDTGQGDLQQGKEPGGKDSGSGIGSKRLLTMALHSQDVDLLKNIFDKMEEIKSLFSKKPKKSADNQSLETTYSFGNDIERVVANELALLANPSTKLDFLVRYANHSLMLHSPTEKLRTPVVVAVDCSGSMRGNPYHTACGFALALMKQLHADKRGVALMTFCSEVVQEVVIRANEQIDITKIIKILMEPSYGGTDFDAPFTRSFEVIKAEKWKGAAIVLVTDGFCGMRLVDEINELKAEYNTKIVTVCTNRSANILEKIADEMYVSSKTDMINSLVKIGNELL